MKDIFCPGCKKSVLTVGFTHDPNTLAMKCGNCNGIVFPTTKPDEDRCRNQLQSLSHHHWQKRDLLPIKIGPAPPPTKCPAPSPPESWIG